MPTCTEGGSAFPSGLAVIILAEAKTRISTSRRTLAICVYTYTNTNTNTDGNGIWLMWLWLWFVRRRGGSVLYIGGTEALNIGDSNVDVSWSNEWQF
jgi:hypothetical protein